MIYHITTYNEYENACEKGTYETMSLQTEGFTHCSNLTQVIAIANELFSNKKNLCLLYIDESLVTPKVVFEDLYNLDEKYPHIYGPLNMDAIIMVKPLKEESETFILPIT